MLVDVPKPKAGSGQVVNKVGGAGLCHTDLALVARIKVDDSLSQLFRWAAGFRPPLFPDQLPEGATYDAMINRVMGNEIIRGKLLSTDSELTLVVVALDPSVVGSNRLNDVVGDIRTTMAEDLAGARLTSRPAPR